MPINQITKKTRLKLKWLIATTLIIAVLVVGVSAYMYSKIDPLVAARLKETIRTSSNGLYSISFSSLKINPFSGNVIVKDIVFQPNMEVYMRLKMDQINPSHLFVIKVKSLKLKRVHPIKAYLKHDLVINEILIGKPTVKVYYEKAIEKDSTKVDNRTAWQRLSKYLHSFKVKRVMFREIDFQYIDRHLNKPEINSIKNLSLTINDILVDSLSHLDKSRFYYTKDILVEITDNQFSSKDGMYTIKFDKFEMSSLNKYAMVRGLKVIPKYPEIEFSLKWKYKKARYAIGINETKLNGIDFKSLTEKRQLFASSLVLSDAGLDVFMNKQMPKQPGDLGTNFPQLMLKELRLTSTIDTVKVANSKLSYTEYDPYTMKKGRINFIGLGGQVLNVTNDSTSLKKNHWSRARFTGYPYGKGRINLNINFNLTSAVQEYNYAGKLYKMQARHFNQIVRPLALLDISSGTAKEATFSVKGDYRNAKGQMTIIYNDLNIGILKLNRNKKLQRSTLLSLVANNLLLKEDNPSQGEPLRKGKISYSRPDSISFYSMIWNSLFSGIKENIGMTAERERDLKLKFESFKGDGPAKTKEQRKLQREERRKRRTNKKSSK